MINVLADRCLLYLYTRSKHIVDVAAVRAVLQEESQALMRKESWHYRMALYVIAACVAFSLLAVLSRSYVDHIYRLFRP